jgi:hypothetical protein
MTWVGSGSTGYALCASAGCPLLIQRTGGGGTIGVAGVLGQASFECGDPPFLLRDNGEQLQD